MIIFQINLYFLCSVFIFLNMLNLINLVIFRFVILYCNSKNGNLFKKDYSFSNYEIKQVFHHIF